MAEQNSLSENIASTTHRTDKKIWGIYIALVVISLIELYSASSREVTAGHIMTPIFRHALLLGLGCLIMLGLQRVNYKVFRNLTWVIVWLSIGAAIYTMFFGQIINGARRSFSILFISIQPSELLKFSTAILIARVLGDSQERDARGRVIIPNRSVIKIMCYVLVFCALLVNQGLTNTILLIAIAMSLLLIGGISWKQFGIIVLAFAILGGGYYGYSKVKASMRTQIEQTGNRDRTETRENRLSSFFEKDKYNHPITSENQQAQYSFIAQANGGILGVGPGNSRETARLPLAFSDYIYAIIIEDGGLVAGLAVISLYLLLLARAGRVGMTCRKVYPTLLIIGMAVFIVYQALFHMAIVTGVFPVSGQPLPFISKGGSSVIISSIALGVMLSVSRFAPRKGEETPGDEKDLADNPLATATR